MNGGGWTWDNPPADGHPRDAFGCRCIAEPVWPAVLSKSRLPTPSEQAINNATFSTFFAFYGVLGLIRSLVLAGSAGLTALRSGYEALVRSFMRSVAQKEVTEAQKEAMQKAIEKMKTQVKEAAPKNPTGKTDRDTLTLHGHERLQQRGISEKEVRDAIEEANRTGRVTLKMGKYGTPQTLYETEEGLTVVVETSGRNTGKVITAWRKQP